MKKPMLVLAILAVALAFAPAQNLEAINKSFEKKLGDAQTAILKEKFKAIEKYLKDPKNKEAKDLGEAMIQIAELGLELGMVKEARSWADQAMQKEKEGETHDRARVVAAEFAMKALESGDSVRNLLLPVIENTEKGDKQRAFDAARSLAFYLSDSGDKKGAEAIWDKIKAKVPVPNVIRTADVEIKNLELFGSPPKAFQVTDMKGQPLSLEALKGKVVLLDFWATWCGPCVQELPNVIEAYKKYHAQGFEIVGISLDEDKDALEKFLKENDMPWVQFFDGKGWKNEVAQIYEVKSIPATYLIDRKGNLARIGVRGDALVPAIERFLAKK